MVLHSETEYPCAHRIHCGRHSIRADSEVVNNPVGWFKIYVRDKPRAKAFYEAL